MYLQTLTLEELSTFAYQTAVTDLEKEFARRADEIKTAAEEKDIEIARLDDEIEVNERRIEILESEISDADANTEELKFEISELKQELEEVEASRSKLANAVLALIPKLKQASGDMAGSGVSFHSDAAELKAILAEYGLC